MIQFLSRLFSIRAIQSSKGFSIIGVLVASSMGLIVIMGLSSMLSNMNTEVTELKKNINQQALLSQMNSLLLSNCTKVLSHSLLNNTPDLRQNLFTGGSPIKFPILKKEDSANPNDDSKSIDFFDTRTNPESELDTTKKKKIEDNAKKLKNLYGLVGHTKFELKCGESSCDCSPTASPTYPCQKDWNLSLFTMSYKNNFPTYKYILNQGLKITYQDGNNNNGTTDGTVDNTEFTCRFGTLGPVLSICNPDPNSNNHICPDRTTIGSNNTFFGANAGRNNTSSDGANSFYGHQAGSSSDNSHTNAFFGAFAGENNRGNTNSFFGIVAGQNNLGAQNSFFGATAGEKNTEGYQNSFFGYNAGKENTGGNQNSFFGYNAGKENTGGNQNSFFGYNAGKENTGENERLINIANVIYGKVRTTVVTNWELDDEKRIDIYGTLRECDTSGENCAPVILKPSTPSSREYKKNIVLFEDYETALEALLQTPLFTYQHKSEYPRKKRMGVIAEELPLALQLPGKEGEPVKPDWPSIYGYLWSGIKALHKDLRDFRSLAFKELAFLKALFRTEVQSVGKELKQELQNTQEENQSLHKSFKEVKKETHRLNQEIKAYKKEEKALLKEIAKRKKQQKHFQKELNQIKQHYQNKK